ncbi:Fe-S cluster assembly ATPase SufC [Candidatus Pacearchaeota archaeon]|nr:Fe-S cluster assembly ATPase SufC [Candidatus Pacearchaeota archaeon]
MTNNILEIKNLHVSIKDEEETKIIKGLNLELELGTITALMGPNGSGKSTLANVLMGNPQYLVTEGEILFNGKNILDLSPDERARLGIFMSFQYPTEVEGVTISNFLRTAYKDLKDETISVIHFKELLDRKLKLLRMPENFSTRYLNKGFSGGEKKKSEILQMSILNPKLAILDETDSGLDIDALKSVADGINALKQDNPDMTILIITHYKRILEFIKPDKISIIMKGKVVLEGKKEIVDHLEEKGYSWVEEE